MEYTRLGTSGLKVSRITLGCISFGDTSRGFNQWALNDEQAEPIFRQAVELGITFWDTANAYGYGIDDELDAAYRAKYRRYAPSIVDSILTPRARSAAVRLVPR